MRLFMAISSSLLSGFFVVEAIRLWTIDPHQAYAAIALAIFLLMVSVIFCKDAGV